MTFHAEVPDPEPLPAAGQTAGIDLGLKDFAVLSDGERIPHPRHMDRHEQRLQRYQRRLARCQKGVADRWFPSSKTCSACGFLLAELSLGTRWWACPACGIRHDRDLNAARNILAAGLAAAAGNGGDACGADVRHGGQLPRRPR